MKKVIKMYLYSSEDSNFEQADELGLSEEATQQFKLALYEVECEVEVDMETGETKLLSATEEIK